MLDWAFNYSKEELRLHPQMEGLQVYAVYERKEFPNTLFLVLGSGEVNSDHSVFCLGFYKDTLYLKCLYTLKTPIDFKRVGYIYRPQKEFCLKLCKINKNDGEEGYYE